MKNTSDSKLSVTNISGPCSEESGKIDVSIIIPVYNNSGYTKSCIEYILNDDQEKYTFEIIVVDNASTDNTSELMKDLLTRNDNIRYLRNETNLGFGKACNIGAVNAMGSVLIFLNNDTKPLNGWMTSLVERLNSDKEIGIVGSKLLYPDNTIQHCGITIEKLLSPGNPSYFRYTLPTDEKRQFGAKMSLVEIKGGAESICLLSLRDLTRIIEFEEKLKKAYSRETYLNRLKSAFLQNLSHEIRTPYNSIVSYSNLIDEFVHDQDFESLRELFKSSREVLKKVLNLFNNILEVAQIESGEIELNTAPINIKSIITSVYSNKKADADSKGITLGIDLPEDDLVIETDWIRIEKVISILIDNSITTTYSGGVEVSAFEDDGITNIRISDTGNGIDEDELKTLLEPAIEGENGFYSSEGVGLGLPVAMHLIRLMNGRIEVSSVKNAGTTVNITFPSVKI